SERHVNAPILAPRLRYRLPSTADLEPLSLDQATQMIADRVIHTRAETWEAETPDGKPLRRTLGMHFLGGATLDNEENYLIKKFFTAMGAVSVENQARI